MSKIISIIIVLIVFSSCKYEEPKTLQEPRVDKRVELLSIVFRLADCNEYTSNDFAIYVEKIESHFDKYKNHELIKYIKDSIRTNGVGFDAVMKMAINITEPPLMEAITPFTENIPEERWGKENAEKFLQLLNQFYTDSDCDLFFRNNEDLYEIASKRFLNLYKEIDIDWYTDFYGESPNQEFIIVNALGNGGGNYGAKITNNNKEIVYAIMGTWMCDSLGLPIYNTEKYLPTLIHEFSHSFVNHNIEKHKDKLASSGVVIYEPIKEMLQKQAYSNWETMYFEAVVRASVVKYLKDHNYDKAYIDKQLTSEINRGFIWTDSLVEELERYSNNREKYPTFNSFMPEIVKLFDYTAQNIEKIYKNIDERRPSILEIKPFNNGSKDVSSLITKIEIVFNHEIKIYNKEKLILKNSNNYELPVINNISVSNNNKLLTLEVDLKPNKEYQIILNSRYIKTLEGYNTKDFDNIEINYKTK